MYSLIEKKTRTNVTNLHEIPFTISGVMGKIKMGQYVTFIKPRIFDTADIKCFTVYNQLLQLCTARTAWSDSVIRSETSLITESDRSGPIR